MDRVTVKGSMQPMELYTYDVPDVVSRGGAIPDDIDWSLLSHAQYGRNRDACTGFRVAGELQGHEPHTNLRADASTGSHAPSSSAGPYRASLDAFFRAVPPTTSPQFRAKFVAAVECYLGGPQGREADWVGARGLLREVLRERPEDGPGLALLHFIAEAAGPEGQAPKDWPGYKTLQHK
eukprot:1993669-Rhodomonas_salina.1